MHYAENTDCGQVVDAWRKDTAQDIGLWYKNYPIKYFLPKPTLHFPPSIQQYVTHNLIFRIQNH